MKNARGFTLIEILIVIAVIGALVALLLPAVQASREAARRVTCQNHLHQLALGCHTYHDAHRSFPPGDQRAMFSSSPTFRGTSLFVHLLPFIEERGLYDQWEFKDPGKNTDGGVASRTATVLEVLVCPADSLEQNPAQDSGLVYGLTSYGGNGGTRSYLSQQATLDGVFHTQGAANDPDPHARPVRLKDIRDGASRTLLLGERSHNDPGLESFVFTGWTTTLKTWGWWAPSQGRKAIGHVSMSAQAPINYRFDFNYATRMAASPPMSNSAVLQPVVQKRLCAWGSNHPGGANFAFADGSVRFMPDELPLAILRALSTRSGGELVADELN